MSAATTTEEGHRPDTAAIRARVLGGIPAETTPREAYAELQARHQVDRNQEEEVTAFEDPTLVAHIEAARLRLAEQEKALLRYPQREALRTSYLQTMGQLSTLIRQLDEEGPAERENVEVGHHQARALDAFSMGRKPHGFPAFGAASAADPGTKEAMGLASQKAARVASAYEGLLARVESVRGALFVLRREIEAFGDGLLGLLEASEEERRRLREVLQLATQSRAAASGPRARAATTAGHHRA